MAFLFKRKNKAGEIIYYIAYKNFRGELVKTTTGCKSKKAANDVLKSYLKNDYTPQRVRVILFSELETEVLNFLSVDRTRGTLNIYHSTFKHFISVCKNIPVTSVEVTDIVKFRNTLANKIKPVTVNIYLRTLKSIFNIAMKLNFCNSNPARGIPQLKTNKKKFLAFTDSEKHLILNSMPDNVYRHAALFAFHTGFRLNEICNVQIKDIDLSKRIVSTYCKSDFQNKTESSERSVPVSDTLYNMICNIINSDSNIYEMDLQEKYLFRNKNGNRFDKNKISRKFKECLRKLNFDERYHFHCTRHTFASELARKGIPINDIAVLLGQKQIETTKIYLHSEIESLRRAVNCVS